ncbi:MAG: aminotransferase class V-fold PLP-dependent enzyme, partial [bacterium]|nr:aminotransferase class V-fold PLP-dependent enzyme [bacterium]
AFCISHIDWLAGRRLPIGRIGRICRKAGVLLAVDGAQSCGQIPVDIRRSFTDVYTLSGQKWLMGPQGTGAVFVRQGGLGKSLNAAKAGYHSARRKRLQSLLFEPFPDARRFESSTLSPALVSGLNEAVSIWRGSDPAAIERRILQLAQRALDGLSGIRGVACLTPPDRPVQSGLIGFRVRGMDAERAAALLLKKHKVVLRAVDAEPPAVRASIHYLNTDKEIDQLIRAVHRLATRK